MLVSLRAALVAFLVPALALLLVRAALAQAPQAAQPSAAEAWQRLKAGNARFVADKVVTRKYAERRAETAKGQHPFAVVLTCADSRTCPELIFDQGLGDIFVLRVAGNVADPVLIGSIEYALQHFHTPLIVVLGHTRCGAVKAAMDGTRLEGNLRELVQRVHVGEDLPKNKAAALAQAIRANALYQAAEMTRRSEVIRDFVKQERARIVTGIYDLKSGLIQWLEAPPKAGKN
jgi:carbonic anhydrase